MTRKGIFRFEGANPSSKAMFHVDLTGSLLTLLSLCLWVTVLVARRGHTGLWFAFFCLSYLRLRRVNVKRKREGKNVFSFQGRCINAKEISALDRVRITFLEEQGYHWTLAFYFREAVKFRQEKTASTLQRKLHGHPIDVFPLAYILILPYQI